MQTKAIIALILVSTFICSSFNTVYASTLHRVAEQEGYKEGQLQNSLMIKKLNKDLADGNLDDYDTSPVYSIADPLEPWNRFWFGFNDIFFMYVANPLYTVYDTIVPDDVQSGLSNFLNNLLFPVRFVNALLQGKVQLAGVELGRFMINSTVGMAGFIDVAQHKKTVVPYTRSGEDFGQTLGAWGIGQGFYLVLPILGPSSARGLVGSAGDFFIDPTMYFETNHIYTYTKYGLRFNELGTIIPLYEDAKAASIDPYIAMREAYATYRQQQVLH